MTAAGLAVMFDALLAKGVTTREQQDRCVDRRSHDFKAYLAGVC